MFSPVRLIENIRSPKVNFISLHPKNSDLKPIENSFAASNKEVNWLSLYSSLKSKVQYGIQHIIESDFIKTLVNSMPEAWKKYSITKKELSTSSAFYT